ncbi:hypothetical protein EUAN_00190 [Andreesenia angusta]|uniref:DUF445 domain-containing protein n=1 Tax=Andreesenia angusta TaxID=39480 RepID=A0A1S1VAH5_9FIRM|nr:DUF445 family protein [Andreesenia angusta]OHW63157.1 hypothetical protein EUAN_00190 [Andreesenia angusta]
MSDFVKIIMLAAIGAGIGWITNYIAIKLMFRPLNPVSIGGIKLQGLIPKRKAEIAKSIGQVVEQELLSMDDLVGKLMQEENIAPVKNGMRFKIREVVENKLPSIIPASIKNMIVSYIDNIVEEDGDRIIQEFIENLSKEEGGKINFSEIVEEKINSFELDKIEQIVVDIANKELKHIEAIGAFLGLVIGLVQGAVVVFA